MKQSRIIRITVIDFARRPIIGAKVTLTANRQTTVVPFDDVEQAYVSTSFRPDRYRMAAAAKGLESQARTLYIGASGTEQTFVLGKRGMPFYYRGTVKVPFEPRPDVIGAAVQDPENAKQVALLRRLAAELKLTMADVPANYRKSGLHVLRCPSGSSEQDQKRLALAIRGKPGILAVGPLVQQDERNASLLTDEIVVRFKDHVEQATVERIAARLRLAILRTIPYAGNAYQLRVTKGGLYDPLAACDELVSMDVVEYAEPNLFHTFEDDAITPANYLFPEQWDHPLIRTPDAWQVLNDNLGAAQRFGSPDVVVAVVDSGVNTNHPQFTGTVSSGQPKLLTAFNFAGMVANNNALGGSHGTCCASAALGFTATSSVAGGVPDGTVGVAGNCRLMAIRRGGTEADYADMYVWIGGFNPNSARAGFPATLTRGADIITSSYGAGFTAPIAGVMQDAFDHLTTYGRGGRGVILTFSVGNYASHINFHLQRPWAAYGKTFACGASSYANDGTTEVISGYSGAGTQLDLCAPSHDDYVAGAPLHNPPQNYGAWTATVLNGVSDDDGNAPRNREIQSTMTAAAATGATSIAVASAAGMVNGQAILVGNPSPNISPSEAKRITGIAGNTITFTPALHANKANGTAVNAGNRDYRNHFGGTSYATPVIAGVAALMLSVNNRLTWVEVMEILRATAAKIDPGNTDPTGRWRDTANRISTDPAYTGPFFSQFYGYGRVDAAAAVDQARTYPFDRDIVVRDNLADTGAGTSASPWWEGADIWVRNANDGVSPASYATHANTVHQSPMAGQSNWLRVRYKNRGTAVSYPFYVRAYVAHYPGAEFVYPDNFIPTVRPNGTIPNPLTPGTYLIGEQLVSPVAANGEGIVTIEWPAHLVPPQTAVVSGITVAWHPCVLVEVSPHDGFVPTGNHVWDDNNLAQKNLSIVYPDSSSDNAVFAVLGTQLKGRARLLGIELTPSPRGRIPYFLFSPDPKVNEILLATGRAGIPGSEAGSYAKNRVLWVPSDRRISFQLPYVGLTALVIGLGKQRTFDQPFELSVVQSSGRRVTGSFGVQFRVKGRDQ